MAYGYIYKISFPNGKCYIGLTTRTIKERWVEHNNHAKAGNTRRLYNALRKYNMVDTFQMIVIDTAETEEELCEKEIAHIEINNSNSEGRNGYNMNDGGDGVFGYRHTEEGRQKISEAQKKRFEDTEARQKLSEAQKKRYKYPESRQKLSEAQKKRFENLEARLQISETNKKRFEDPEARLQISEGVKKYYEDNPEARQKNSEAQKKYNKDNPEKSKKHSEVMKKRYKDNPEKGKKHSEIMKKHYEDPEARQKLSEATKKCWKDNPELRKKILDAKGQNKPFDVFEKNGTFIKSFNYQFEAREYLQKTYEINTHSDISAVLRGTRNSSHGFTFKYKE